MQYEVDTRSDPLNVRRGPSTGHSVVGALQPGEIVTVDARRGDWRSIGPKQWVHGDYLRAAGERPSGGRAEVIGCRGDGGFIARLWDFRTGSSRLRRDHRRFLDERVLPHLAVDGGVRLIGLASRIGPADLNRRLSRARAHAVASWLRGRMRASPAGLQVTSKGEAEARKLGVPDADNQAVWRAVLVQVSDRRPPPPPKITPVPDAGTYVKRKVELEWVMQPEVKGPSAPGEDMFQLTKSLMRMASPEPDRVEKERVHVNHLINEVRVRRETHDSLNVSTTVYTVTYEWGPPEPNVTVDMWGVEHKTDELPRRSRHARWWMTDPGEMLFRGWPTRE